MISFNLEKIRIRSLSHQYFLDELPIKQMDFKFNPYPLYRTAKKRHYAERQECLINAYTEE